MSGIPLGYVAAAPKLPKSTLSAFLVSQHAIKTRGRERFILSWVPISFQIPSSCTEEDLLLFFLSVCFEFVLSNPTPPRLEDLCVGGVGCSQLQWV